MPGAPSYTLYQRLPGLVLGFHGCDADIGEKLLRGEITHLAPSTNKYDWLGNGIYFWENDPLRAWEFAQEQHKKPHTSRGHVKTPFVLGAVIDLGLCLNLTDRAALDELTLAQRMLKAAYKKTGYQGLPWTTRLADGVWSGYPIYDWSVDDIWTANARHGFPYNRLYDLFHMAGLSVHEMRVASPFNDWAIGSLQLYRVIEPAVWSRMIGRVNGANFCAIYGGTDAVAWKKIKLPAGHTWRSYVEFLLNTLPEDTRRTYEEKFATSIEFWRTRGGVLSRDTIKELQAMGVQLQVRGKTNYATDKDAVTFSEYPDDADVREFSTVPSYKRMAICILKNDHLCKYMGFSQTKKEMARRRAAVAKYADL